MGWNFKFQVQDSFLEFFFWIFGDLKKQIALSEKKPPLDVNKFEGLPRKASSQKFVVNSSTLDTITISVPHHII